MSNELSLITENPMKIWEDKTSLAEIRKIYAKDATDFEFSCLVGLGKATDLNPFLREIWLVKYKDYPAQIFIGRDGYRKTAQKNKDYDYHQSDAVYENDNFEVIDGAVRHAYKLVNRGSLVGAYCVVQRHGSSRPMYVYVPLQEYNSGSNPVWKSKPSTMIKKVAEAQALRATFQEQLGGTYDDSEDWSAKRDLIKIESTNGISQTERAKQSYKTRKGLTNEYIDNAPARDNEVVVDVSYQQNSQTTDTYAEPEEMVSPRTTENKVRHQENTKPINEEQLDLICGLIQEKAIDDIRLNKALHYFEVDNIESMNQSQAERMITMLSKLG